MRYVKKIQGSRLLQTVPVLLAVAGVSICPGEAEAQRWTVDPLFRAGVEFDDNARLDTRTDEEITLEGLLAEASAAFLFNGERTNFSLTPRLLVRRYSDEPEFDSEDVFARGKYSYLGQRNNFDFRLNYERRPVRLAERSDADLDAEDPDDIADDSTGRVALTGDRSKWRIRPSWEFRLSPTSSFTADIEYFDVRYSGTASVGLVDYTDTRLRIGYQRSFSQKTIGIADVSYRMYERDVDVLGEVDGYNAVIGFAHQFSPTTRVRAVVGVESSDQPVLGQRTEPVWDVSLVRRLETLMLSAAYRRVVNASGSGQLTTRDSIILNLTRDLNEKISAGIGLRAYQSENLGDLFTDDRNYLQLRSRFTWYLTRRFAVSADYRYTILDRGELDGESANGNQLNLWFEFEPWPRDR